jgi:glycosyltransferase involved in cell wall biosynthesis
VDGNEASHRAWMAPYADAFRGCRRVLDVGSGPGTFLDLLRERGIPGLGIDFDPEMVDICRERGLEARVADARQLDATGEQFDGIHAGHVVEHMPGETMVRFLEECYELLQPDGLLIVRTPNWDNETVRNGGFWLDHTHVRPYPLPLLERIFLDIGLDVVVKGAEPGGWNDLFIAGRRPAAHGAQLTLVHSQPAAQPVVRAKPAATGAAIPVAWEGSQLVYHSLAHVNRELCVRLADSPDLDLSIIPFEQHQFDAAAQPRFAVIEDCIRRAASQPAAVHVRHQWPPNFTPPDTGAWVMIQPWEFGGLPAEWIAPMRDKVDEIWTPTEWVRQCYVQSGISGDKVKVIPNGVDLDVYRPDGSKYPLKTKKTFKFLFLGGTLSRKGIDVLLKSYFSTFTADDDVCLVIKAVGTNGVYAHSSIEAALHQVKQTPNAAEFEYISSELSDEEIASIYRACDALVHPYRGEGFGMPIAEAMATGLPVIATNYGACLDFCDAESAFLVPAVEAPLPDGAGLPPTSIGYWWAEPDQQALAALMKQVVANPRRAREVGMRGRARISEWTWERSAALVSERINDLAERTPVRFGEGPTVFGLGVTPLPLVGRRGTTFLHQPVWSAEDWKSVVTSYSQAFTTNDDVTLVLWLDPSQGLTAAEAGVHVEQALAEAGLDPDNTPDMLLVPDELDMAGLARLYAAIDWVVPNGAQVQAERARLSGARVLDDLSHAAWRFASHALPHESNPSEKPLRKALASLAVGPHQELRGIARETLETYANRHGYELHLGEDTLAPERPVSWSKVQMIRDLLKSYDVVLWVDADAIIVDPSQDIAALIEPGKFLYVVQHEIGEQRIPNLGVFMVLAGEPTERLLDEVWRSTEFINHPWWENAAVLKLLGYNLHPCRLREPTALYRRVKLIDKAWNSVPLDASTAPFIKHYAGVSNAERSLQMRQDLQTFRSAEALCALS